MKITATSEQDKVVILWNCIKFYNTCTDYPNDVKNLYITPDLTPAEQKLTES